jgi:NAD(P)-dependent dehydrogenase (short-subunit alcohol dehydrogenase family)
MVGRTETELGPVTILVNNAGVAWQGTLDTYDRGQVARMRQVNVEGMIHATRAVMGACGRGATVGRGDRHRPAWQCFLRGNQAEVARPRSRSGLPSAYRYSITMFCDSMYPKSRRPRRNAPRLGSVSGVPNNNTPIRGIFLAC